jgi:DNA polymerase III epsilon subunit-like protein
MALFIDTETNGLPNMKDMKWGKYPDFYDLDKYNTARIVQLSFIVTDKVFNNIDLQDYIIKREGFNINNSEFHCITDEISDKDGVNFNDAFYAFYESLKKTTHIFAHNIEFDISVIKSELYRRGLYHIIEEIDKKSLICTMRHTKDIIKIVNKFGKYKYPSLKELYRFCFDKEIENAHNSKYDVINLYDSIKKLYDNKNIYYYLE